MMPSALACAEVRVWRASDARASPQSDRPQRIDNLLRGEFAMSKQMFFFTGVYETVAQAEQDYDAIKQLHDNGDLGSYDAAVLSKKENGEINVNKDEKPVKHGGWIGLAAGAGAAILFPPLAVGAIGAGAAGAGLGAWFGHLAHGMSRSEAKEMAHQLQPGDAALIVIGIDEDAAKVEQATGASRSHVTKHLEDSDFDEAEREAVDALEQQENAAARA
jgi:uncharacterized membrane protein